MTLPARAVVGAGAWGTTLALHLARKGPVTLLARDEVDPQEGHAHQETQGVAAQVRQIGDLLAAAEFVHGWLLSSRPLAAARSPLPYRPAG